MESASLLDEGGAVVQAQEVAEHVRVAAVAVLHLAHLLGLLVDDRLHAAGDVHEGPLRRVAEVLLVVDGVDDEGEHGLQGGSVPRRQGRVVAPAVALPAAAAEGGQHLLGQLALAQSLDGLGQHHLGQAHRFGLLPGQGVVEGRDLGAAGGERAAAPERFGECRGGAHGAQGHAGGADRFRGGDQRADEAHGGHGGDRGHHPARSRIGASGFGWNVFLRHRRPRTIESGDLLTGGREHNYAQLHAWVVSLEFIGPEDPLRAIPGAGFRLGGWRVHGAGHHKRRSKAFRRTCGRRNSNSYSA